MISQDFAFWGELIYLNLFLWLTESSCIVLHQGIVAFIYYSFYSVVFLFLYIYKRYYPGLFRVLDRQDGSVVKRICCSFVW